MRRRKSRAELLLQPAPADQRPESLPVSSDPESCGGTLASQGSQGSQSTPTPSSVGSALSGDTTSGVASLSHPSLLSDSAPEFSCGTSEEEADGDEQQPAARRPAPGSSDKGKLAADVLRRSGRPLPSLFSRGCGAPRADLYHHEDGDEDNDDDDDDDEVDTAESMEEHKSVIMHLLSQVKLGMDLTKVVLPTFILERRSLLEMYADFFAHPDLFVRIAAQRDARERMVAVVRWYLSAFHAGRRGSIAKKPYNPVLGETFRCYWELPPGPQRSPPDGGVDGSGPMVVLDGPVPWATRDQVAYVAEQVSHHPPISAFYAECYNQRIQFMAHIWTKSKFLGVSVGVQNIGQGCVSLLSQEEDYILTFPSGYGRSILTVPWVELGGECSVRCARSGFQASVTFHTKPFYGSRRHRVTADIYEPKEKKPFCSIEGEWNGVLFTKETNGLPDGTLFMDTRNLPTMRKKVRRPEEQQENESQRLWREVTLSLRAHNLEAATEAKHRVEERQRAEARARAASGAAWETRLFQKHGENWEYTNSLARRLEAVEGP